jgi:hypothetical protein
VAEVVAAGCVVPALIALGDALVAAADVVLEAVLDTDDNTAGVLSTDVVSIKIGVSALATVDGVGESCVAARPVNSASAETVPTDPTVRTRAIRRAIRAARWGSGCDVRTGAGVRLMGAGSLGCCSMTWAERGASVWPYAERRLNNCAQIAGVRASDRCTASSQPTPRMGG